jgi:hypothetical protein
MPNQRASRLCYAMTGAFAAPDLLILLESV